MVTRIPLRDAIHGARPILRLVVATVPTRCDMQAADVIAANLCRTHGADACAVHFGDDWTTIRSSGELVDVDYLDSFGAIETVADIELV